MSFRNLNRYSFHDDSLSSGVWNIDLTCLRFGARSGAVRNRPEIVLDSKVSAVSARSIKPLLKFLNACECHQLANPETFPQLSTERLRSEHTVKTLRKSFTLQFFA